MEAMIREVTTAHLVYDLAPRSSRSRTGCCSAQRPVAGGAHLLDGQAVLGRPDRGARLRADGPQGRADRLIIPARQADSRDAG